MNKIPVFFSKVVLALAFLNVFAWCIYHVNIGGQRLGVFTDFLRDFSRFPVLVGDVISGTKSDEFVDVDVDFTEENNLEYDIFAVNAHFEDTKWIINLVNLKDDSVFFKWYLEENTYYVNTDLPYNNDRIFSRAEPTSPLILKDTSLILHNNFTYNLMRLNAKSEIVWKNNEMIFHHVFNQDKSGNIWVCTTDRTNKTDGLYDDHITKVDVESGETLYHKSLAKIFIENDLGYLVHGYTSDLHDHISDPLHLNDIQPALKDGPFWKADDLFISLRHRSLILLYRPSTNKIIRIIQGPFYNQHDVDILSDTTISLFNNNVSSITKKGIETLLPSNSGKTFNNNGEVLIYNFKDSSFTSVYPNQFSKNGIFTETEGLHHFLSNGDLFVEEQNNGKVYIFNQNELLLKKYYNKPLDGSVQRPHWVRIYENINFLK